MTLTDEEYIEFLDAHLPLLHFVGQQLKIISGKMDHKAFMKLGIQEKFQCRQGFLQHPYLLDKYLQQHWETLTQRQINILGGFKKQISGKFFIFKCYKTHAIFIDGKEDKYYAVHALGDRFDDFFDSFPIMVTTTILPFGDKIIYDGFMETPIIYIGSNMTKTLKKNYQKALKHGEIISTIP